MPVADDPVPANLGNLDRSPRIDFTGYRHSSDTCTTRGTSRTLRTIPLLDLAFEVLDRVVEPEELPRRPRADLVRIGIDVVVPGVERFDQIMIRAGSSP